MQEVSGSTPLSSTIVTSKHRKVFGGTATFLDIPDPAQPSLLWRSWIKMACIRKTWDRWRRQVLRSTKGRRTLGRPAHAVFLHDCVQQTIERDLPEEVRFLEAFGAFR